MSLIKNKMKQKEKSVLGSRDLKPFPSGKENWSLLANSNKSKSNILKNGASTHSQSKQSREQEPPPAGQMMMSRISWLFELRTLFDKIKRRNDDGHVSKALFMQHFKKASEFMDLCEEEQYKKMKSELGLTVQNIERRLLNISYNDLTEDLLIGAVMKESKENTVNGSSGNNKSSQLESKRNCSTFFYEDVSESGPHNNSAAVIENSSEPHIDVPTDKSQKVKKSENNSVGHTGSSSNRYFEKRRSSSKSDIETARFNKLEGMTSSRNYENSSRPMSSRRGRNAKTLDLRPPMTEVMRQEKIETPVGDKGSHLLGTFSTIKPLGEFDHPNNSSSKQQKNLLHQLEKQIRNPNGIESFEFTQIESKNASVQNNPNQMLYEILLKSQHSQDICLDSKTKNSIECKETTAATRKYGSSLQGSTERQRKYDEERRVTSRNNSKRSLKSHEKVALRKASKSRDTVVKRIVDNVTRILEKLNSSLESTYLHPEEKKLLDALNALHIFEFKNICVLGLDLKDLGDMSRLSDSTVIESPYFKQLISNTGLLRIKNTITSAPVLSSFTPSNTILLTLTGCELTNLSFASGLENLKLLNVNNNRLQNFNGLQKSTCLAELYANNNQISTVQEIKNLKQLKVLFLNHNTLSDLSEFQYLRRSTSLVSISIVGNPICVSRNCISSIKQILPKVKIQQSGDIETTDYKDFYVLWKDGNQLKDQGPLESVKRERTQSGARSARRQKSSTKSKRERHHSGIPEEHLECYGFIKKKDLGSKPSLSQLMLGRQESAPLLLREKISQLQSQAKGLQSSRSKKSIDKSTPGHKSSKRTQSRSGVGRKLIF